MMTEFTKELIIGLSEPSRREVISGVYFLIYKDEIVYIGSAFDILSRIKMHKDSKKFMFHKRFIKMKNTTTENFKHGIAKPMLAVRCGLLKDKL